MIPTDHALSPKSGHGNAIRVSWGLVQIPVRLHLIADDDRTVPARSMFVKSTGNRVGLSKHDKVTGAPVDEVGIVKKVEVSEGTWVELTDDEIEQHCAAAFTKGVAEITCFVPLAEVAASYVIQKPGVWLPEKVKVGKVKVVDPAAHKAYSLLVAAMKARQVAALIMVPNKSGGQYVALFPDGRCGWLCYAENVRQVQAADELPITEGELNLANQLIDGLGVRTPVLRDEAGERIRTFLIAKAENPDLVTTVVEEAPVAEIVDLAALLQASIAAKASDAPAKPKRGKKAS